jgi:hypothetical protein
LQPYYYAYYVATSFHLAIALIDGNFFQARDSEQQWTRPWNLQYGCGSCVPVGRKFNASLHPHCGLRRFESSIDDVDESWTFKTSDFHLTTIQGVHRTGSDR